MANEQPPNRNTSPNSGSPTEVPPPTSNHLLSANRRMEIEANPRLKLHLEEWMKQFKVDQLKIETYLTRCSSAKAELDRHMSFYVLFQGVVLGALSNGSKITCETSFIPIFVSFLTYVATAFSVHSKLSYYETETLKCIRAKGFAQDLVNKINQLRNAGENFKFEDIKDSQTSRQKKEDNEAGAQRRFYWVVMFGLFLFSFLIWVSCIFILCFDASKHELRLCFLHKCKEFVFHRPNSTGQ